MSTGTKIFQRSMLDHYFDQSITDQLCFVECSSLYYTNPKPVESTKSDCRPVVLNDEIVRNKVKAQISKRVFQENKAHQIFRKTNISYSLIRIRA